MTRQAAAGPILDDAESPSAETLRAFRQSSLLRCLLSPADDVNATSVGDPSHDPAAGELPDSGLDPLTAALPATYSSTGFGIGRSVKADVLPRVTAGCTNDRRVTRLVLWQ